MRRTLRTDTPAKRATSIWSWPAASKVLDLMPFQ